MEQDKKMLEKALRKFGRINPKHIAVKNKHSLDLEEYSIRVDGFKIVLIHKDNAHFHSLDPETAHRELYGLRFIYLRNNHSAMSFDEGTGNLGRIKETYYAVEKKVAQYDRIQEERKENILKRKLRRLEKLLK